MKTKIDFVTNSSSSSFLIADFRKERDTLIVRFPGMVVDLLVPCISKELGLCEIKNYEEYVRSQSRYEDKKVKEVLEKGGVVYSLYGCDTSDHPLSSGLKCSGFRKGKFDKGVEEIENED